MAFLCFVRTLCSDKTSQKTAKIVVRFRRSQYTSFSWRPISFGADNHHVVPRGKQMFSEVIAHSAEPDPEGLPLVLAAWHKDFFLKGLHHM